MLYHHRLRMGDPRKANNRVPWSPGDRWGGGRAGRRDFLPPLVLRNLLWASAAVLAGCGLGEGEGAPRLVTVDLEPMEELLLDETDEAYVSNIGRGEVVQFGPAGELAVLDEGGSRVILFDRSGALDQWAGREGEGPGEFGLLLAASWDPVGRLWVADPSRITVLDRDLAVDTTFRVIDGGQHAWGLTQGGDAMFVAENPYPVEGPALRRYDLTGEPGPVVFNVPPRDGEPYVLQQFRALFHITGDTVVVASSLSYPLHLHDLQGNLLDTFGTRPPSIGEVTYPGAGAFAGGAQMNAGEWQRSFGTVRSIWFVHDSLIVVEHTRRHPEAGGIPPWSYWIDVYDRWTLEKLAEDIPTPSFVVDVHDDLLWIRTHTPGTSEPLGGPWGLTGFRVVIEEGDAGSS